MAPRAYWKGYLKLSLVSCPISLFPATSEREKISFHQLHKQTGNRIKYKKVDAETGREVESDDIIKGYEVSKGEYIEIDPEELEAVAIESKRVIEIDEFVPKAEIDELYLNNPYYIVPDGEVGQQAFAVIREAIRKEGMVALGKVVFTSREHIIALEARGKGLMGVTLRYPYEVRSEKDYFDDIEDEKVPKDMLELAAHIVDTKRGEFDPKKFEDRYEDALKELLRKKQKGEKIERPNRKQALQCRGSDGGPTSKRRRREGWRRSPEITLTLPSASSQREEGWSLNGAAQKGLVKAVCEPHRSYAYSAPARRAACLPTTLMSRPHGTRSFLRPLFLGQSVGCDPMATGSLSVYQAKRDFTKTAEPSGKTPVKPAEHPRFVIQKHAASRLHYDLRLEVNGVFKSWAVTKGPSLDPRDRRLAVEVEDHPLDYGDFEGTIPQGEYGGGTVMLWDRGFWAPEDGGDPERALRKGELKFTLAGEKLKGSWVIVRMRHDRERSRSQQLASDQTSRRPRARERCSCHRAGPIGSFGPKHGGDCCR